MQVFRNFEKAFLDPKYCCLKDGKDMTVIFVLLVGQSRSYFLENFPQESCNQLYRCKMNCFKSSLFPVLIVTIHTGSVNLSNSMNSGKSYRLSKHSKLNYMTQLVSANHWLFVHF